MDENEWSPNAICGFKTREVIIRVRLMIESVWYLHTYLFTRLKQLVLTYVHKYLIMEIFFLKIVKAHVQWLRWTTYQF